MPLHAPPLAGALCGFTEGTCTCRCPTPMILTHTMLSHVAASFGRDRALGVMLQLMSPRDGARTNALGWTPLHCAASQDHLACVEALLRAAPESATVETHATWTPLHCAADRGHTDCAAALIRAWPGACQHKDRMQGWTPLFLAARRGFLDVARLLLSSHPAGLLDRDKHRLTPLDLAGAELRPALVKASKAASKPRR